MPSLRSLALLSALAGLGLFAFTLTKTVMFDDYGSLICGRSVNPNASVEFVDREGISLCREDDYNRSPPRLVTNYEAERTHALRIMVLGSVALVLGSAGGYLLARQRPFGTTLLCLGSAIAWCVALYLYPLSPGLLLAAAAFLLVATAFSLAPSVRRRVRLDAAS